MKHLIMISTAIVMTSLMACTNNKEEDRTSVTEQQTASNTPVLPSQPTLPTFNVENINGNTVNLQSFKGKKVFVNLWASWCPPCKREMPSIEKLYHSVDTSKVAFVMIALDDQFEKSKSFIRSAKLELPIYYPAENLPSLFNVQGIPSTFIFSENGGLIKRMDGGDFYDTDEYRTLLK